MIFIIVTSIPDDGIPSDMLVSVDSIRGVSYESGHFWLCTFTEGMPVQIFKIKESPERVKELIHAEQAADSIMRNRRRIE